MIFFRFFVMQIIINVVKLFIIYLKFYSSPAKHNYYKRVVKAKFSKINKKFNFKIFFHIIDFTAFLSFLNIYLKIQLQLENPFVNINLVNSFLCLGLNLMQSPSKHILCKKSISKIHSKYHNSIIILYHFLN